MKHNIFNFTANKINLLVQKISKNYLNNHLKYICLF